MKKLFILFLLVGLIGACGTPAFFLRDVNRNLSHSMAVNNFKNTQHQYAFWGGTILSGENLKDTTELVVLAYPLDNFGEPIQDSRSYGRFIVVSDGYLERGEYAKDRRISLVGKLVALRKGKVDESSYTYPVLHVRQMKIWAEESDVIYDDSNVRFHFGIGIHRHHHW